LKLVATAALYLVVALLSGVLARLLRLPPLLGFLVAGFALAAGGAQPMPSIDNLASLGVTLLLFAVGLKLDVAQLLRREVWLTAVVHTGIMVGLGFATLWTFGLLGLAYLVNLSPATVLLLAFALSFSSTVLVVKILDERSESRSRYGQIALGILVIQDLIAVVFLAASTGKPPSLWALCLILLLPARKVMNLIWSRVGHDELQVLFGVFMALIPGYYLFELVGLKGDLGAVVMGMLLSSNARSGDLQKVLFSVKELLIVAFFVSIGLTGVPSLSQVGLALLLLFLLPVQALAFVLLISAQRMRRRTAVLAALVLGNNSEFGLIVAATAMSAGLLSSDWVVTISVAVAASFVLSALINLRAEQIADWVEQRWPDRDVTRLDTREQPIPLYEVDALIFGMGRIGSAAFCRLQSEGLSVLGVEHDEARADKLIAQGLQVISGDATDSGLWRRLVAVRTLNTVVLAMPFHHANIDALRVVRSRRFTGLVIAVARYQDELEELLQLGADSVLDLYGGSGVALAEAALGSESTIALTRRREAP
jgi:glutathione-regulated potassium-efflux system ancillary protein KefC